MDSLDFNQLKADWYKKAKESGFNDIETPGDSESTIVRKEGFNLNSFDSMDEIYQLLCEEILKNYEFKSERNRFIFELHAQGLSEKRIELILAEEIRFKKVKHSVIGDHIRNTVKAYKELLKIKLNQRIQVMNCNSEVTSDL